jgi:catechol 2,3-dioxygenase
MITRTSQNYTAAPGTSVGHVHLRVADLNRSIAFYRDILGFSLQLRVGNDAAFLGAAISEDSDLIYHHHIDLNTWGSREGTPAPPGHTGLFHAAISYPNRTALSRAIRQVLDAGILLTRASDHGISEAVYLDDPDENGLELYFDRKPQDWPRKADGSLAMFTRRLDLDSLLTLAR